MRRPKAETFVAYFFSMAQVSLSFFITHISAASNSTHILDVLYMSIAQPVVVVGIFVDNQYRRRPVGLPCSLTARAQPRIIFVGNSLNICPGHCLCNERSSVPHNTHSLTKAQRALTKMCLEGQARPESSCSSPLHSASFAPPPPFLLTSPGQTVCV